MENKGLSMLFYLGKLPCDILLNVQIGWFLTFLYFSYMDSSIKHIGIEASVHYKYGAQLSFVYWTKFPVQYLKPLPPLFATGFPLLQHKISCFAHNFSSFKRKFP